MGVEPTESGFADRRHAMWLQRRDDECPCQESNLVYDLRRVACFRYTSRTICIACDASTRTRTRNVPLEAGNDLRFTIEAAAASPLQRVDERK